MFSYTWLKDLACLSYLHKLEKIISIFVIKMEGKQIEHSFISIEKHVFILRRETIYSLIFY